LKNISGSSRDRKSGGSRVNKYGRGLFWPLGSLSTAKFYRSDKKELMLPWYLSHKKVERFSLWVS